MAIINIFNNDNVLLINDSFKCLVFHSKGFLIPKSYLWCGRAELIVKVSSKLPPLLFLNCCYPVSVEALYVLDTDKFGTTYKFVIWGGEVDFPYEYYLFTIPEDISNEKIGAMAMWDENGYKIFDSANKYMSISNIITIPNNEVNEKTEWGKIDNLDPFRTYAFTNAIKLGYNYYWRFQTYIVVAYWRIGCYISKDKKTINTDIIYVDGGFADGFPFFPGSEIKQFSSEKGLILIIDVTNY